MVDTDYYIRVKIFDIMWYWICIFLKFNIQYDWKNIEYHDEYIVIYKIYNIILKTNKYIK